MLQDTKRKRVGLSFKMFVLNYYIMRVFFFECFYALKVILRERIYCFESFWIVPFYFVFVSTIYFFHCFILFLTYYLHMFVFELYSCFIIMHYVLLPLILSFLFSAFISYVITIHCHYYYFADFFFVVCLCLLRIYFNLKIVSYYPTNISVSRSETIGDEYDPGFE